jgi:hypothetical protein
VTRPTIVVAVLAAAAAAAAGWGCATQAPRSEYAGRDIRRNEILMLDGKIIDYRRELGLGPRPSPWLVQHLAGGPTVTPPADRPGPDDTCSNVCDLAAYICRAQEDICRIADDLGEDDWARGKCNSAKASCAEAKRRCTECAPKE